MPPIESRRGVTQCDAKAAAPVRRTRHPAWLTLLAAWLACLPATPAPAADAPAAAPAPAYTSIEQAQAAADAAKAESDRLKAHYAQEENRCMATFFATRCVDQARLERNEALTRTQAAQNAAELYIRREQSRMRHEKLQADNAKRDAKAAAKTAEKAANPAPSAPKSAATPSPRAPSQPPAPRAVDDPAVRAENRAAYERKQHEADDYAQQQARERADAEAKRARRRADREAEAARLKAQQDAAQSASPSENK